MNRLQGRSGFTLVELAIVLVIIGLLVGGVLVGQDLIKAATIRSTVSDIEKSNAAATTFRTKYSGLPGDLLSTRATEYGLLTATGRTGAAGMGDGNGLIESCAAGTVTAVGCETALFWVDLSTAALISQKLNTYDSSATIPATIAASSMSSYLPKQKLRDTAFLMAFSASGKNYFFLGGGSQATSAFTGAAAVTPGEARSIDEKFDDAYPTTGVVVSESTTLGTADAGATTTSSTCMQGTASPKVYNVLDANINNVNCMLALRTNF